MTQTTERKIEVRPLPLEKWHGKSGGDSIAAPRTIFALPDETMKYQVAISEEKLLELGKQINQDLSTQFILGTEHPFWEGKMAEIKLEDKTMFFFPDIPLQAIKIGIMKSTKCKDVANSLKDWRDGLYPEATHYIVDEEEEVELFAERDAKRKLVQKKVDAMPKEDKENIVFLIEGKKLNPDQAEKFVDYEMSKIIDKKFDILYDYLNRDREDINLTALIEKAVKSQIIIKEGFKYKYEGTILANNEMELIDFLKDDENQMFKLELISKVKNI